MPDYKEIYRHHAEQYELLVSREDYQGNLLRQLQYIATLNGLRVVEFGAGTGRITRLLAPHVEAIFAFDNAAPMLRTAAARLNEDGAQNAQLAVADNRHLPLADHSADLTIAAWSFGHFCGWYPDTWPTQIGKALAEMKRLLRRGGSAVIIETLGTGRESPQPPHDLLAAYYNMLQNEYGFTSSWLRTDYRFESLAEAEQAVRFFFSDDLADRVLRENLIILPECTGIWWRVV